MKITQRDYEMLKRLGMLTDYFPKATGDYFEDLKNGFIKDKVSLSMLY